ncbi:MAG: LacI family DNA-binding transcriptional regulator [Acidobacteriaceae bacterium]|nr:LacI family DNA-binding transcriptional regulator [Acidobacteriaceae bacterium]
MPRRSSRPTMKDIAARANVSIGTVSRVLNRHQDVDSELRQRVEAVVSKLGYRLKARTRSVVHTRARIIGLILCNEFVLSAAHSLLMLGVEEYCAEAGYYLLFARHEFLPDQPVQNVSIPAVTETPGLADCVIMVGTVSSNVLAAFARRGLRYVLLANHLLSPSEQVLGRTSHVRYDDELGCYEATKYLAQLGHSQICYIGDDSRPWHISRYEGYQRAMGELGLESNAHKIALSDDDFENGQAAISYILDHGKRVTAILAASDELAFGAREGLRQHHRDVPKDVSLIGFEHQTGKARGSNLTSVSVDMVEVGRQLARMAILQMESQGKGPRQVVIPTVLVKRSTCRPLRKEEHMLL